MRIGIDATALYGRYGGVEYALWNLLVALDAATWPGAPIVAGDWRFTVYIPHDGPPPAHRDRFGLNWHWVRLPFDGGDKARRVAWQQTVLGTQARRDGCDLLHCPTYISPLLCPLPVVLTVYDFIALTHPQYATKLNRLHYGAMLPRSVANAHRIIVPSEAVKRELERRVPSAAPRAFVVPLGVEPMFRATHDDAARSEIRARLKLPDRYLLFVGNPEPKKNLRNLLRARALLPREACFDVPLLVAGGARSWSGYELPADSSNNGSHNTALAGEIWDAPVASHRADDGRDSLMPSPTLSTTTPRTISLGYVARRDLPLLYAMCEAFAFPSLVEGFGLPVLEALASGAPVVTSDRVPLPDLQRAALVCNPHDVEAIARHLEAVLRDNDLRADLSRCARDYARDYTWQRTAAMTLDVYKSAE